MSEVDAFLRRMIVLYGPPDTADEDLFYDEYRAILGRADPALLVRTGDTIRDTLTVRRWPTPAEVLTAIRAVAGPPKTPEHKPLDAGERQEPTPEQRERVAKLMAEFRKAMADKITTDGRPAGARWPKADRDTMGEVQRTSANAMHRRRS